MAWNYKREESEGFKPIPEGIHRIRVKSAEEAVSKSGNDMLVLQFEVSGYNSIIYHYITFMKENPEMTNRNLTKFFDSFKDIPEGEVDTQKWIGKVGACQVKHEEYNGKTQARLHYFISADKQADLPPWQEPAKADTNNEPYTVEPVNAEDDLPW